ncbi:hypothetical protein DSM14862_00273 [Sulfitobacter indolifex]|uniref:Uncharacterized protein n=1 Tax=Sulfitobacter indolifex HEL-45 TaxID=391624 RepID=A0ABP2DDX8_9RHOB|nr:hypothetical protein [Sulfitobacter indolifex]EDQ06531.1 hypothetical protein OIHEL45_06935 [Sulfitobacter indolifex HEL-45]UOA17523.1 hypothetical protein DSM14862_00273 [Sulfitobacter indolifex]
MSTNKQAKVAKVVSRYKVVLNVGEQDGVDIGSEYILYRVGEDILDPDTGESLGAYEQIIGRGVITHVQDRISTLESSEIKDSGRKIVRKFPKNPSSLWGAIGGGIEGPSEEVIEEPEKALIPFSNAEIGDFAKEV